MADIQESDKKEKEKDYKKGSTPSTNKKDFRVQERQLVPSLILILSTESAVFHIYLKGFYDLWYEEYLLSLREQSKDLSQVDYNSFIRVIDVVVVKNLIKLQTY